ncbi:MAG: 3-dehydroquinate synthase [Deltaproteobacteria bacterium]|nr:3-dehydroquinate synthase [Deltaproteobacteria bacterium]
MTPPSVALAGMPGAGKSAVGPRLAALLGRPFVDTDRALEARLGMPVAEVFKRHGEAAFRAEERALCLALLAQGGVVCALGGGSLEDPEVRSRWLQEGTVLHLRASIKTLLSRLQGTALSERPLLADGDLMRRLEALWGARSGALLAVPVQLPADHPGPEALASLARERVLSEERLRSLGGALRLVVRTPSGGYPLWLGDGALGGAGAALSARGIGPGPVVLVSHPSLEALAGIVTRALTEDGYDVHGCRVTEGERHKTLVSVERVWDACLRAGLSRGRPVVAVGGGVVGDLAGFAAATYLRGVPVVQVPTTLLAMVDSSVGAKTGVDLPEGKNLVGAFHPPTAVLIDPTALGTLPREELSAGMAEVLKHGLLGDPGLFERVSRGPEALTVDASLLARAVAVKLRVVEEDPYEEGLRAVLNLGHTFGHAIERVQGYAGRHGDAVATGLVAASALSEALGLASPGLGQRVREAVARWGLPTRLRGLSREALTHAMGRDKKRQGRALRFVALRDVGAPELVDDPPEEAVMAAWDAVLEP